MGCHGAELDIAEGYGGLIIVVVTDDQMWGAIALPQERPYGAEFAFSLKERDWAGLIEKSGGQT